MKNLSYFPKSIWYWRKQCGTEKRKKNIILERKFLYWRKQCQDTNPSPSLTFT